MSAPRKPARGLARYVRPENALQTLLVFVPVAAAAGRSAPLSPDGVAADAGTPADAARLKPLIQEAQDLGVRVSLFMDPNPAAMAATGPPPSTAIDDGSASSRITVSEVR